MRIVALHRAIEQSVQLVQRFWSGGAMAGCKRSRAFIAKTMSLDIYKQSIFQNANIYLFSDGSVANRFVDPEIAHKVHQTHLNLNPLNPHRIYVDLQSI